MAGEKTRDNITFRIRHTMMLVSDLDRSIDFYTRLLGMDIQRIRPAPDRNERVGYLGYGSEDEYPGLELIETGGPGHVKEMPKWYGHVALYVSDLYKLSERLKAEGVKFTLGHNRIVRGAKTTLLSFRTLTVICWNSPNATQRAGRRRR
jgi:lactoylglutathione lyase